MGFRIRDTLDPSGAEILDDAPAHCAIRMSAAILLKKKQDNLVHDFHVGIW